MTETPRPIDHLVIISRDLDEAAGVQAEKVRPYVAGTKIRVADLSKLERILEANSVAHHRLQDSIVISANRAHGVVLEFTV